MSRVLENLRQQQQAFAVSPFITLVQDSYFTPRMRLGFLPCLAPFVKGFVELEGVLRRDVANGAPATPGASQSWALYVKDLQTLELPGGSDLASTLQLLWSPEASPARRALYDLMTLASRLRPMQRQVFQLALESVGSVSLRAVEQLSKDLKACTGKQLVSLDCLRTQLAAGAWGVGAVELDLPAEMEQEALATVKAVFGIFTDLFDQMLDFVQRRMEVENDPLGWERTASLTFQQFGNSRLQALCEAVGYDASEISTVQRFFSVMSDGWGAQRIGSSPPWLSEITDDHTPFEFSVALEEGAPEVRFLIEAQNSPTTLQTSWDDGVALNERLKKEFGIPLERFNLVKELFEPRDPAARFSLWHAFCLKPGGKPAIKLYLNPRARGSEHANEIIKEALARLGFANAWRFISEVAMRRGELDQVVYFSLDLSAHRAARIKVYIAHKDANAEDIEYIMSQAKEYVPGEAYEFYRKLQGDEARFQVPRGAQTCLSFTSDDDERPYGVQLYVPVRCYAENDQDAMTRIASALDPRRYALLDQAVQALAHRPLESGVGLIQWAAMRREGGRMRTTFYLATEAYSNAAARTLVPQGTVFTPKDQKNERTQAST
jgi:DMATS type aromatic prenyltransferase